MITFKYLNSELWVICLLNLRKSCCSLVWVRPNLVSDFLHLSQNRIGEDIYHSWSRRCETKPAHCEQEDYHGSFLPNFGDENDEICIEVSVQIAKAKGKAVEVAFEKQK